MIEFRTTRALFRLILAVGLLFSTNGAIQAVPGLTEIETKTDIVHLLNGDRLTGEIKGFDHGKLRFKTAATDTISIEWPYVVRISSDAHFDVWLDDGSRLYGSLSSDQKGSIVVADGDDRISIDLDRVTTLNPIEERILERLDGFFDFGFNFTQADHRTQLTLGAEIRSRSLKHVRKVAVNSILTFQDEGTETRRHDIDLQVSRFLKNPSRLFLATATFQHNEELNLDLRSLISLAYGWIPVQSSTRRYTFFAGGTYTHERLFEESSMPPQRFTSGEDSLDGVEALLGFHIERFTFVRREREISILMEVFPSLTESSRIRVELEARFRLELLEDVFLGLTLLESFDSSPPVEGAERNDLSVITSLGWSF